jgi:hypothetical protein
MKFSQSVVFVLVALVNNSVLSVSAQLRSPKGVVEQTTADRRLNSEGCDDWSDWDKDGVPACVDECPFDGSKSVDKDGDGDGTPDCMDECPQNRNRIERNGCGCWIDDQFCSKPLPPKPVCTDERLDTDKDGVPDCLEKCPYDKSKVDDVDGDGDGTPDCMDECPQNMNRIKRNGCGCWVSDEACNEPLDTTDCAKDSDGDGLHDCADDCPYDSTITQDADGDGDGTPDCMDECPQNVNRIKKNACGCWTPDEACTSCPCFDEDELDQVTAENQGVFFSCDTGYSGLYLIQDNYWGVDDGVEGGFAAVISPDHGFGGLPGPLCSTRDNPQDVPVTAKEAEICANLIKNRCKEIGSEI